VRSGKARARTTRIHAKCWPVTELVPRRNSLTGHWTDGNTSWHQFSHKVGSRRQQIRTLGKGKSQPVAGLVPSTNSLRKLVRTLGEWESSPVAKLVPSTANSPPGLKGGEGSLSCSFRIRAVCRGPKMRAEKRASRAPCRIQSGQYAEVAEKGL
jgi:hypothetical protein